MTARTLPFPASGNLGDLIRPDVPRESLAVIDVSASGRRWSCAKLNAAAEGFAASLVRAPLATDARVAILGENCAEYLIAYMGTMRAGCVSVPVNHRLPPDTVRYILADCRAELCVVDAAREALIPPALARIVMRSSGAAALKARQRGLLATLDLSSVKAVTIGSAPLTEALVARVQEMFPQAAISNGYGTTEAGPSIFEDHPQGLPRPPLSLGYPLPDVEVRLVGGTGDEGVLEVRCPAMFTEYLNLPSVTGAKLRDGWYDTGDVMRRDGSGFYYFTGRADDMFVCGGENVYPGEIEKMLERHPAVLQAAVVAVPDEIKGEIPIAFVVLKERSVSVEDLKRFALESGPAHSHPRAFVVVDELPVATTHKLDKRPLKARALEAARALKR